MILFSDLGQAVANLRAQKTRTLLTALGIVFGVGSVIGMLAIGSGAREESLRFIEQLGVRNVLIDSRPATSQEEFQQRRRSSPGLADEEAGPLWRESSKHSKEIAQDPPRGEHDRRVHRVVQRGAAMVKQQNWATALLSGGGEKSDPLTQ